MSNLSVSGLSIYPVKSCAGIEQIISYVEDFGLQGDRRWMVVDSKGVMLTQRKFSSMCLIKTEIFDNELVLKHAEMENLTVAIPSNADKCLVKVWADQCEAFDSGDMAASWLSQVLETECRLVYFPDDEIRQVDLDYANPGDKTAFSDGFPLLLISQASLNDLNARLSNPITMNRFRPNLVLQGCEPFAEDSWKRIRIGEVIFKIVKPCSRCVIPSINLETAQREDEPTKTLSRYRRKDNKIFFGQNLIAENRGEIKIGMSVEVLD